MNNVFNYSQFDARVIIGSLTPRERQVTEGLVMGETPQNIADELGISRKTVEVFIAQIRKKFGVEKVTQLGRIWFCGILDAFDPEPAVNSAGSANVEPS